MCITPRPFGVTAAGSSIDASKWDAPRIGPGNGPVAWPTVRSMPPQRDGSDTFDFVAAGQLTALPPSRARQDMASGLANEKGDRA